MKLIIVGGSGFIARNFLKHSNLNGFDVTATYNSDKDFPHWLKKINLAYHPLKYDLLGPENDFSDYAIAVYLAGNANHTWAALNPDTDLTLNAVGLTRFLKTFKGRLILFSSAAVYFGQAGKVDPDMKVDPHFPYAISKLAGELYTKWAYSVKKIDSYTILRFYYAFGPGEEDRRLIKRLLIAFGIEGKKDFSINGDGKSLMAPLYVEDVARAIELAVKNKHQGIYDLTSSRPLTVYEIVKTAAKVCEVKVDITFKNTNELPLLFYSKNEKFAKDFHFTNELSLEEGMKNYLTYLKHEAAS